MSEWAIETQIFIGFTKMRIARLLLFIWIFSSNSAALNTYVLAYYKAYRSPSTMQSGITQEQFHNDARQFAQSCQCRYEEAIDKKIFVAAQNNQLSQQVVSVPREMYGCLVSYCSRPESWQPLFGKSINQLLEVKIQLEQETRYVQQEYERLNNNYHNALAELSAYDQLLKKKKIKKKEKKNIQNARKSIKTEKISPLKQQRDFVQKRLDWLEEQRQQIPLYEYLEQHKHGGLHYEERISALQAKKTPKKIEITSQAQAFLAEFELAQNSMHFHPSSLLQMQSHYELITLVNRLAQERVHDQQESTVLINTAAEQKTYLNNTQIYNQILQIAKVARDKTLQGNIIKSWALVDFGNALLDCTMAYTKGVMKGASNNIQNKLDNPAHALTQLALCVGGMVILPLCPISSAIVVGAGVSMALINIAKQLNDLPLVKAFEKAGEMSGDLAVDLVIVDRILKATSTVTKIVVDETVGLMQKAKQELKVISESAKTEINALADSEEILMNTAEGFEIAVNAKKSDVRKEAESLYLEMNSLDKTKDIIKSDGSAFTSMRELVLPKCETFEQARNKALEIVGEVDYSTGDPIAGKFGVCRGKTVGRRWHSGEVTFRLDYDPKKGPHINVTDFRVGKGTKGTVVAIPFEGNEETVKALLKHLQ